MACLCLSIASGIVLEHVREIREVGDIGLPAAGRVTALEQRLDLLRQQMEATQAQAALKADGQDEVIRTNVLPPETDLAQILSVFDLLHDYLTNAGLLREMSAVTVGDPAPVLDRQGITAAPVTVRFVATQDGVESILLFFELSGFLTVGDALTPSEREQFIVLVERENAAGLPALEEFLRTPLLTYARGGQAARDELMRNFGSPTFMDAFERIVQGSRLPQVRYLLGGTFGGALQDAGLWPLRFMTIEKTAFMPAADGTVTLDLTLAAYARPRQ